MSYPGPITPEIFSTEKPRSDGDFDANVIDSYDIETDAPPNLKEATQPIPATPVTKPSVPTRMLTRSMVLTNTITAFPLFPFDPNRKSLTIRVTSMGPNGDMLNPVLSDGIRIASDLGDMYNAGVINHGQTMTDCLSEHTGHVYIVPTGVQAGGTAQYNVRVDAWTVTV